MAANPGKFITLEGGEGAGKSTLAKGLAAQLEAAGYDTLVTREPGGTPNAEAIRAMLMEGDTNRWSPLAETLLLYAARVDHVEAVVKPAMAQGIWVSCDRFSDSTRAYQGAAGGLPTHQIEAIHAASLAGFAPDLTLVVDLDPEVGLARTLARGETPTRFERHPTSFHHDLRQAFLDIAEREPVRCAVIDGREDAATVRARSVEVLSQRLGVTL